MSSQLPPEQISMLADLLGSLSRLVVKGSALTKKELETLLMGAGLESTAGYLDEIKRWGKLLSELRKWPSEESRSITAEALKLRGLPEASILLAVSTVMEGVGESIRLFDSIKHSSKKSTGKLKVVPEKLELVLSAGQGVQYEFIVEGGPGRIVVETDKVKLIPQEFGEEPTHISLTIEPFTADLLFTTLKFISSKATIEVPIIIQLDTSLSASSLSLPENEVINSVPNSRTSTSSTQSQQSDSVVRLLKKAGDVAKIGDIDGAIDILLGVRKISPDNFQLHLDLASCYQIKDDLKSACMEWEAALGLEPGSIDVSLRLATCYNQLNRFSEAITLLETASKSKFGEAKDEPQIARILAVAYHSIGRDEKAIELLSQAQKLKFDPKLALLQKSWQRSITHKDNP